MENNINFESLLILSLSAFITPIIMSRFKSFKLPAVVGEILVGIIIGKSFLGLVNIDSSAMLLSSLGLAFLMFLSGLEIDTDGLLSKINTDSESFTAAEQSAKRKIRGIVGLKLPGSKLSLAIIIYSASVLISFIFSLFMYKFNIISSMPFYTVIFTSTAPGLLVPFLKERELIDTEYGQTILVYSLTAEIIVLLTVTILCSYLGTGLSYKNFLFIVVFAVSFLFYLLAKYLIRSFDFKDVSFKKLHIEVRAAFALILVLVFISNMVKSEIVLGSFLAGIIFSLVSKREKEDLIYKFDIIGYGFLIPIFFIQVGVNLNLKTVFADYRALIALPIFIVVLFLIKMLAGVILTCYFGWKKSLSFSIITASQLSLLIVGAQIALNSKVISSSEYSVLILTAVISCIIMPYIFDKIFDYSHVVHKRRSALDRIGIRETVITNQSILNKPLKDIELPYGSRVFLIIRGEEEILPDGNTIIKEGDRVIIAGTLEYNKQVVDMLHESN